MTDTNVIEGEVVDDRPLLKRLRSRFRRTTNVLGAVAGAATVIGTIAVVNRFCSGSGDDATDVSEMSSEDYESEEV